MDSLQKITDETDDDASLIPDSPDALNRQKESDLARAQARSVVRPIKKELRHSQIEGRYIRPAELQKEVDKLEEAKRKAETKKKGIFSRLFGGRKKEKAAEKKSSQTDDAKKDQSDIPDEEKKKKAEQIRKLRGIALKKRQYEAQEAEARYLAVNGLSATVSEIPKPEVVPPPVNALEAIPLETEMPLSEKKETEQRFSFTQAVRRLETDEEIAEHAIPEEPEETSCDLNERERLCFAPNPSDGPDGMIATALSAAVGFIYWDEDGQRTDRIITIRRLFLKQGDILIDAFCHDIGAPRLISFSRGIRLYNLQTMKPYENPREFLLHQISGRASENQPAVSGFTMALSVVRYELTALVYVAKSDFNRTEEENKLMLAYISQRCPTIDFDENEMLDYIAMLVPDDQSFFEALEFVVKQSQDIVFLFTRTFLQMMLSDGVLQEKERELLAELLYLLQSEGFDLGRIGLV